MQGEQLISRIRQYVVDTFLFGDASAAPGDDASLLDYGIVDSTGVLNLVLFVEEQFGIQVGDDELVPANFDSIRRLAAFVEFRAAAAANIAQPAH